MADEREWVVEPPGAGEITLRIAVGEGVELTDEQEAALNELVHALEVGEAEVVGHAMTHDCTLTCAPKLECGGSLVVKATGSQFSMLGTFTPRV
jgi:hypothetical protein